MINTSELRLGNIMQNIYFAQYGKEFGVSEQDVKIAWRTAKAFNKI